MISLGRSLSLALSLASVGCADGRAVSAPSEESALVGVVPYGLEDQTCPQGPDRESAFVRMDDENDTHCTLQSTDLGEGAWVGAHAVKPELPAECPLIRTHTTLRFCRVSVGARTFRPLTTDPGASERFFATLKFGERCPPNSLEMSKRIVNEDTGNTNEPVLSGDILYPNEVTNDATGNYTRLVFCFFEAAESEADTMAEFPELGFPYAVFHDFEGSQPEFVIRKRWMLSDDSNQSKPQNSYEPDESDPSTGDFQRVIENPFRGGTPDTIFDLARVR